MCYMYMQMPASGAAVLSASLALIIAFISPKPQTMVRGKTTDNGGGGVTL